MVVTVFTLSRVLLSATVRRSYLRPTNRLHGEPPRSLAGDCQIDRAEVVYVCQFGEERGKQLSNWKVMIE